MMSLESEYITVAEMRKIDSEAVRSGIKIELMMENAGKALATTLRQRLGDITGKKIVCIAGKGNNGGGVIASLRHLDYYGAKTTLVLVCPKTMITEPSRVHLRLIPKRIKVITYSSRSLSKIMNEIKKADVVMDGILGTGFSGRIDEPIHSMIDTVNKSRDYVISNDIPSGIEADTGIESTISIHADFVVVLHKPKKWITVTQFSNYSVESIGIPSDLSI